MTQHSNQFPQQAMLYSLPRPVPDWAGQTVEFVYLLGSTLWMGVHASATLLTIPLISRSGSVSLETGRLMVWLLESLGFVAAIAAGLLLLTILGIHLLRLRRPVTVLVMLVLVLLMTVLAVGPQLWFIPKIASQLRMAGLEADAAGRQIREAMLLATQGMGLMGMLHLFFGAILVGLGARRCYRYPLEELPVIQSECDP